MKSYSTSWLRSEISLMMLQLVILVCLFSIVCSLCDVCVQIEFPACLYSASTSMTSSRLHIFTFTDIHIHVRLTIYLILQQSNEGVKMLQLCGPGISTDNLLTNSPPITQPH